MEFFVNELSLHGQFAGVAEFRMALKEVEDCRKSITQFDRRLYVLRSIGNRPVTHRDSFREAVRQLGDINITRIVMAWIDRHGPFVDDIFVRDPDEYYVSGESNDVVTDQALGECAARIFRNQSVGLVSFAPSDYAYSPVEVRWHQIPGDVMPCEIDNFWSCSKVLEHLQAYQQPPDSWHALLLILKARYLNLVFAKDLLSYLAAEPFSAAVANRVIQLLQVLDRLAVCFDSEGGRTAEGEQLVEDYFRRSNARITDASEKEKTEREYRSAMTFPNEDGIPTEYFWHAKISTNVFRIHFSYPIVQNRPVYIAYIGPKLTKK
jgi:hypothetical protein